MTKVMKDAKGVEVSAPFPRMKYADAMARYGSDKPDTRFEMELTDLSEFAAGCGFKVFTSAVESGGQVKQLMQKVLRANTLVKISMH